jgi:chaperonin cofactor prefoldin
MGINMTDPKETDEIEKLKLENAELSKENKKLKEEIKALQAALRQAQTKPPLGRR